MEIEPFKIRAMATGDDMGYVMEVGPWKLEEIRVIVIRPMGIRAMIDLGHGNWGPCSLGHKVPSTEGHQLKYL